MSAAEPRRVPAGLTAALIAIALGGVALALRWGFVQRIGPMEGGGDEWWSVWRSWAVLYEGGKPGNYLHPALYYDLGAVWLRATGLLQADLLGDFILRQYEYVRRLEYLSATCGALSVAVTFLLGRRLFGPAGGIIGAAALAFLPLHILYSQAARVDALFVLASLLFWAALARFEARPNLERSAWLGVAFGLVVSANYPGALLIVPFLWIHLAVKRPGLLGAGVPAAAAAFLVTNPALLVEPRLVVEGFLFQAGMASHAHPGREGLDAGFYWQVLREQGLPLSLLGLAAALWFAIRGRGTIRILAVTTLLYLLVFVGLRTQFDRYILPPLAWLCLLLGGLLAAVSQKGRVARVAVVLIAALLVVESARQARHRWAPDWQRTEFLPAEVAQRWLIQNARPGERIWIDSDVLPLMQAVFADPGGGLQQSLREAFRRIFPTFDVTLIKGERIERSANFDKALIRDQAIQLAVVCEDSVDYARSQERLADQVAFYELLASSCPVALSFDRACVIRRCGATSPSGSPAPE